MQQTTQLTLLTPYISYAANVLMKSREDGGKGFTCKIADLGLSRLLDKHNTLLTQTVGTLG